MKEVDFERGEFERTLKDYADRFFLIPSERVWKSIYNDIHPGSKWPSLAAGLFMLLTLFWVGKVNNREFPAINPVKIAVPATESANQLTNPESSVNNDGSEISAERGSEVKVISIDKNDLFAIQKHTDVPRNGELAIRPVRSGNRIINSPGLRTPGVTDVSSSFPTIRPENRPTLLLKEGIDLEPSANTVDNRHNTGLKTPDLRWLAPDKKTVENPLNNGEKPLEISLNAGKKNKLTVEYFITPMISNVAFSGTNLNKSNASVINSLFSSHNVNKSVKIGIILGANAYYQLSDRLSVVSGLHVVHTGYDIYSDLEYPKLKSLTFMDRSGRVFSKNYISYYGNDQKRSDRNITNFNWQLAVPVGAEMKVAAIGPFDMSILSTFEPFLILGSRAYLLTGDASGFVTDPDLIRRFNANVNLGTMFRFRGKYMNWRIGPTVRYQLMSTYNHIYPVKEHFINYGFHVGVSKK